MNTALLFLAHSLAAVGSTGEGMTLLTLVVILAVLAAGFVLVERKMAPNLIRTLILIAIGVVAAILLLEKFGIWDEIRNL